MKKRFFLLIVCSLYVISFQYLFSQTLDIKKTSPKTSISVVKRVEQEYYLLTKDRSVELTATGPTILRVFTRLLWQNGMTEKQSYKLIIKQGEQEKILPFESEKSNSAYDAKKEYYGKWRSFYLDIPSGSTNCKLTLLDAKSETVAVRFSFEKPKEYKKKNPETPYSELQFVEKEKITNYYEVKSNTPVKVKVEGPVRIKAVCRLNYDYTLEGRQNFTVAAVVQGKEWQSKTFRVLKSETGFYKNASQYIPSTPENFFINVPPGNFLIEFHLKGGLAKSAGVSFYTKPLDSYE